MSDQLTFERIFTGILALLVSLSRETSSRTLKWSSCDYLTASVVQWSEFLARERKCIVSCEVRTEFICYVEESRPPLWSSSESSWLQIQGSVFDSRRYQIFWEVVGLEPGPLSLGSTTEELLGRKSSGSGLENREYGRGDSSRWPRGTLYRQKLALTSSTSGDRQHRGLINVYGVDFNDFFSGVKAIRA
jgi:hypothetical protein